MSHDSDAAGTSVQAFYDQLAAGYHLIYPDWDGSMSRQSASLDRFVRDRLGEAPAAVLDCACGIGTQAIGLALRGHRVVGTDLSPRAAGRATEEAARRGVRLPSAAADMRRLPFGDGGFDVVVCADNSLPHLLTREDVHTALVGMRRVLRGGGLLLLSTRPYDRVRSEHPASTLPQLSSTPEGRAVTFQLWEWHDDGERYDTQLFQLVPEGGSEGEEWRVRVRRTTYWALTREQLSGFVTEAGFTEARWYAPESSGFFQPLLVARAP